MRTRDTTGAPSAGPVAALILVVAAAFPRGAEGAPTLEEKVRGIDRNAAQRLLLLGTGALRAKQRERGLEILARVVELDADNTTARRELGYVRGPEGWTRAKDPDLGPPPPEDAATAERAAKIEADAQAVEVWRAREIAKVARTAPTPEAAKPHLLPLLDRLPRLAEVHEALGHARVGDRYVRPELLPLAQDGPARVAAWRALAVPRLEAHGTDKNLEIPGNGTWPWLRVGPRVVAGTFSRPLVVWRARRTECAHDLLRLLFGADAARWDPPAVCFLLPAAYEAHIRARHPDAEVVKRKLRSGTYDGKDAYALRVRSMDGALDFYTHTAGLFTAERLACPRTTNEEGEEVVQDQAYAWFQEGMGYLLTLELWDTADSHFFSRLETHTKLVSPLAKPEPATRDTLLAWIGANLLAGRGVQLRDVLTRSINALDFHASMEAWAFLRFLALRDPDAFRRLPAALAGEAEGAQADCADKALRAVYGQGIEDLERLWRAWLLEVA